MNDCIMIIGGAGFIGRNLCNCLSAFYEVVSVDLAKSDLINENVFQYQCELTDSINIKRILIEKKVSKIIHCVSSLIPTSNIDAYVNDLRQTYFGTLELLEYCSHSSIQFIFLSSGGVIYENSINKHKETDILKPLSFYGLSKLNIENLIRFYHEKNGLDFLILRPSNPYGFGQRTDGKQGLIATIIGKVLNNEPLEIWGDGKAIRDYIYIDDFVNIIALLIKKNIKNTEINVGSGIGSSVLDVIKIVENMTHFSISKKFRANASLDVKNNVLDISKLLSYINYDFTTLDEGIKLFYERIVINQDK